jgi:hypothetical protein
VISQKPGEPAEGVVVKAGIAVSVEDGAARTRMVAALASGGKE